MEISINSRFAPAIADEQVAHAQSYKTIEWLNSESIVNHEDIVVFKRFKPAGKLDRRIGIDETGMECSLNHFHVPCESIHEGVAVALILFDKVTKLWHGTPENDGKKIRQIVSIAQAIDEVAPFDLSFRFHLVRAHQSWLLSDLDAYEEIILVCE